MGRLYSIIEEHMDRQNGYRISQRQVAQRLGVSPTTLANWREPKELIDKRHLVAISQLTGVPYHRVLDALLADIGYLTESDDEGGQNVPLAK
jgi:transcriptional regulator with XRE-family HTH domain